MEFDKMLLEDPILSGSLVSATIIRLLSDFDESILEIHNASARRGVESACKAAMLSLSRASQRVVVMPEMLPGFTMLSFRLSQSSEQRDVFQESSSTGTDAGAAGELIRAFSEDTGNRLIVINSKDLVLFLFPSEDMAKNLAELGVK